MSNVKQVKVWDPLVRLFHWSLVLAFIVAYLTGEEEDDLHIYAGYVILGLILFRLLWGFIGTRHARFSDFVRSPTEIANYIRDMLAGRAKRYIGHNPAGGAMILALLLGLAITTWSGLEVYAIEEGAGPLAGASNISLISPAYADDDDDEHEYGHQKDEDEGEEEFWEEIHEVSANLVLLLVILHVLGVVVSGRIHHENLVRAMITGRKKSG